MGNHIGFITEAIVAAAMPQFAGWGVVMVSHRAGEAEGSFIADLAMCRRVKACNTLLLKVNQIGSIAEASGPRPCRSSPAGA